MFGITNETRVYLKTGVTDGRLSYEGLRGLVSKVIAQGVRAGHLFAFCNRRENRVKLLRLNRVRDKILLMRQLVESGERARQLRQLAAYVVDRSCQGGRRRDRNSSLCSS